MRNLVLLLTFVLLVIIIGCSPVTVKHDFDHEYDFSKLKTYRWQADSEIDKYNTLAKNPFVYKRVQSSVDKVMQEKGFEKVDSGDADLCVVVHAGVKEKMQIHQHSGYYGWYRPWWGPYGGYTDVSYYDEGTLVIDLVNLETKELAWRGSGTGVVKDYKDSEKMQKDLDAIVAKILANFPPVGI